MKKLLALGSGALIAFVLLPYSLMMYGFRSSGDTGIQSTQHCAIDTEALYESLSESETLDLNTLQDETFKNEVVMITLHQERSSSLLDTVHKANAIQNYAKDKDFKLSKSVFIQSMQYGTSFLDFLIRSGLSETSVEVNEAYEKTSDTEANSKETDSKYYSIIQTEFMKAYCEYGTLGLPVQKPYRITGWFPSYNIDGTGGYHDGIDFGLDIGTPVFSVSDGEVVLTGSRCDNNGSMRDECGGIADNNMMGIRGFGNFVIIKVKDSEQFVAYAHLSAPLVSIGEHIKLNQQIGLSGHSGKSSGPHLHFVVANSSNMYDVVNSNKVINPCDVIEGLCEE
ncbi:M23 family metallopeptidase [Erysipelothrix aquatica]|uniref:M23 family metallopeptidase n=1 Tax=Erysipelothrix aquatica TaxID=2683714 RepID=UPI0013589119|nr:M23 family metallopeptidase [Erysipelothrix aquatica]